MKFTSTNFSFSLRGWDSLGLTKKGESSYLDGHLFRPYYNECDQRALLFYGILDENL